MPKKLTYIAVAFLTILLLTGAFSGGFLYSTYVHQAKKPTAKVDFSLLDEVLNNIDETYYEKTSKTKLIDGAIDGIVESLKNPYASYYPPSEYKHFKTSMDGNYSGIGVVIGGKKGGIKILKVFPDSPAQQQNLKKGEIIIKIGDKLTEKMDVDQAAKLIKGPEGTTVQLTLKSGSKKRVVEIVRKKIPFPNNILTRTFGKTGYISMHFFSGGAAEELKKAILKLEKKGIKNLIFDLRSNPGGQLNEAIDIASLFIDKGVVVKTKNRQSEETVYSATGQTIFTGPMVVLISENSASASEIVAGAIQDRHRGKLVGVKSFGKGTVSQVIPLSNKGALLIPNEKWMTPNGQDITKKGITPDYVVKAGENGVDKQLEKAKALLK